MGGNKRKTEKSCQLRVKTPIHYSPIHLFLLLFEEKRIKGEVQGTSMKRVTNTPSCMDTIRQNKVHDLKSDALWK